MCSNSEVVDENFKAVGALPQDDVDQRSAARAPIANDNQPKTADDEVPSKKRRTRRGRNKRRHPYLNVDRKTNGNVIKPEAPHNSNQFLIEDQGNTKEIDERLKNESGTARTRDSSFSMDSDGDFYSSPDDEGEYLQKDFNDTYENLRVERLTAMSKTELIEEFLKLEKCVDSLTKRIKGKYTNIYNETDERITSTASEFQKEIERLILENETLKRENTDLRNKLPGSSSDSEDSESDSSETCSSCTSSAKTSPVRSPEESQAVVEYSQTNGHSPTNLQTV